MAIACLQCGGCHLTQQCLAPGVAEQQQSGQHAPTQSMAMRSRQKGVAFTNDKQERLAVAPHAVVVSDVDGVHGREERVCVNSPEITSPISMLRFKNTDMLRKTILSSELGDRLLSQGCDIAPVWAKGATVLFPTRASALPSEMVAKLRPYHVLVREQDMSVLEKMLDSLSYKQRPRRNEAHDQKLTPLFVVDKTFVHIPEPRVLSPRSNFTKSSNDARTGYQNPRTWQCDLECVPSASSTSRVEKHRSMEDRLADLEACQTRQDLAGAIECYSLMLREGLQPDTQVFTSIIDICAKTGEMGEAERWMFTMAAKQQAPSLITFNCMIHGYASQGNTTKAEEWFEKLSLAPTKSSLETYNCLVQAHAKRGCLDSAEQWLKRAEKRFSLNRLSFAPIIEYYAHKGLLCKAEEWFNRMGTSGVAYESDDYAMMVSAAANARDLDGARRWVELMKSAGHSLQVHEYTQLLKACSPRDTDSTGRQLWNEAIAIFHDQIRHGVVPNLLNLNALKSAVGRDRSLAVCKDLSIDIDHFISI